jgi:hypothetical protein
MCGSGEAAAVATISLGDDIARLCPPERAQWTWIMR